MSCRWGETRMSEAPSMRGTIRFCAGRHRLRAPMEIGSMRVVGPRNLIKRFAPAALYHHVLGLLVRNPVKQDVVTRAADILHVAVARKCGAKVIELHNRPLLAGRGVWDHLHLYLCHAAPLLQIGRKKSNANNHSES